ncbi:MAG: hypothetical protein COA67_09270 [Lutibacter sp.]|nr:MAG: hypothetical protein COA67_09270 [Lutibacter sp.]
MKYFYSLLVLFSFLNIQVNAQQIILESGKSMTSFEFKDSQGTKLENLQGTTQNYIFLGFRKNAIKDFLHVLVGTSMNSYGTIGSDNAVNNYYEWETTYLGFLAGVDIKLLKIKKMTFYLRGTTSVEFLLQGTQIVNNNVYDLVGEEDFDKSNIFFRGGAVLEYPLSDIVNISLQYKYGKSKQLKNDSSHSNQARIKFKSHDIGFGLIINLKKSKKENQRKLISK